MYPKTQKKIREQLTQHIYPGVSYALIHKGKIEKHTLGYAQIVPKKQKLTEDMLFDVASLTKVICTTTMILKLVEEGRIKIEDKVQRYLPEYIDDKVTIRHLLTHTSDIDGYIAHRDELNSEELKQAILHLKSGKMLGNQVKYTDTGTVLLGFMLEDIYGMSVQQLFKEKILQPLGMKKSTFPPVMRESAVATQKHPKRGMIKGEVHDPKAYTLGEHCGSAGLFTNLQDCLIFVQMILAKGKMANGKQFLQEATIAGLFADWTPTNNLRRSLGWDLKKDAQDDLLIFHTGYTGTFLLLDVKNQMAFIFLSNRVHPIDNKEEYLKERDELIQLYLHEKTLS